MSNNIIKLSKLPKSLLTNDNNHVFQSANNILLYCQQKSTLIESFNNELELNDMVNEKATGTPTSGGTLYLLTKQESLEHIDPQCVYTFRDIAFFGSFVTRTLTTYSYSAGNTGSTIVPDMATDIGTTKDGGITWTFTLKPNITWEDGSEVTTNDIAYGISRTFATDVITDGYRYAINYLDIPNKPDGSSSYPGPYKATKTEQALFDKAVKCSGKTITFKLNKPLVDFNDILTYLAFSPVRKSKDTKENYDKLIESTGPYKIATYDASVLKLVRNTKWNKKSDSNRKAYPDMIVIKFNQTEDSIVAGFKNLSDLSYTNSILFDYLLLSNMKDLIESKKVQNINNYGPYVRYFPMNVKKLNSLNLRKAIFLALNRQELLEFYGDVNYYGDLADGFISPTLGLDYEPTILLDGLKPIGNIEAAKILLDQVKVENPELYKKATIDGLVWDVADSQTNKKLMALIIAQLTKAGIVIRPNYISSGQYYSVIQDNNKQGDISIGAWGADWSNASTVIPELFTKEGSFNLSRNEDDHAYIVFKKLVDIALLETDRTKQSKLWKILNQYAVDQVWAIPRVFNKIQIIYGNNLGGAFFWQPYTTLNFASIYIKK